MQIDNRKGLNRFTASLAVLLLAIGAQACGNNSQTNEEKSATAEKNATDTNRRFYEFTDNDELLQPKSYREWVFVGTPLTPNSQNPPEANFPEFHAVYIDPVSWDIYKETGKFRDGTILVKELMAVGDTLASSGNGYFMGEYYGLEATIKDSKRFPDEPGNWAYFTWGHGYPLAETAPAFPAAACNACHEANAAEDFVFTQYYPVIRGGVSDAASGPDGWTHDQLLEKIEADNAAAGGGMKKADAGDADAAPASTTSEVPIEEAALFKFLQDGDYKQFATFDKVTHPSAGPHFSYGDAVQVWFNDRAAEALRNGSDLPEGAAMVKEITPKGKSDLGGWAVSVKTQDSSDNGAGWFWAEFMSTTDSSKVPVAPGNGVQLCSGCHAGGKDFVLSKLPE